MPVTETAFYGNIEYTDIDNPYFEILEMSLGVDKVEIEDHLLQVGVTDRSKKFINFLSYRYLKDKRDGYGEYIYNYGGRTYRGQWLNDK